jgi:hypothetical protein
MMVSRMPLVESFPEQKVQMMICTNWNRETSAAVLYACMSFCCLGYDYESKAKL